MTDLIIAAAVSAFTDVLDTMRLMGCGDQTAPAERGVWVAEFVDRFVPLKLALEAEDRSRNVALAELRRALDEGLNDFGHDLGIRMSQEMAKDQFFALVKPWLDRLER